MNNTREQNLTRLREEAYVIEPGQKFVVDAFKPEDALGVTRLYHAVYGEMFPVSHVYDPDELVRINQGDDLFQVVGRTPKGDVVGLYALFRSAPGRRIMEAGSWIVHPDYRGTSLNLRLALKLHNHPPEHLGLDVIYGQNVCDHVITQKLARVMKGHHCAIEIEPMPPRPGEEDGYGRISLMDGFVLLNDRGDELYLPVPYEEQLRSLYDKTGLNRTFLPIPAGTSLTESSTTQLSATPIGEAKVVKIEVESLAADFADRLAEIEQAHPGMHAYQLILPLWFPECSEAVEQARTAGFFFGGLLPAWFDRDGLLMQKIAGTPDFSRPQILEDKDKKLLQMIEADWQAVQSQG